MTRWEQRKELAIKIRPVLARWGIAADQVDVASFEVAREILEDFEP